MKASNRYRLKARGGARSELIIYGDIGQAWDAEESNDAKTIVDKLRKLKGGDLDVRINSFGGSVADGLAIFNAVRRHDGAVTTHIDGVAYSIASLIAMAGSDIRIAENGMLMIHAPWGLAVGNSVDMREMASILDKHAEAMAASYRRAGGPDDETIRSWLTDGEDHYFTAEEAVALGLVDAIDAQPLDLGIAAALRGTRYDIPVAMRHINPEETPMGDELQTQGEPQGKPATSKPKASSFAEKHSRVVSEARKAGAKAEADRRAAVEQVFSYFYDGDPLNPVTALREQCIEDMHCDDLKAQRELLLLLASGSVDPVVSPLSYTVEPTPKAPPRASRHMGGAMLRGADQVDRRAVGLEKALSIKSGLITDRKAIDEERRGEYLSLSLTDIMSQELRAAGYNVSGMREDIARQYINAMPMLAAGPSHGTDHLPAVLGNIANLSAMKGWESAEETWSTWTVPGTLNDYKTATRANVALLDKLAKMQENQEWEYGNMADVRQRITGYFHGLKYSLSLQAIVNDELGELTRTMEGWGEAGSAAVGDAVHAVLFTAGSGGFGQSMDEDSVLLFHATHGNYLAAGAGGVPSETTLDAGWAAMMTRTDPNKRKVTPVPRYLIHGPALRSTVYKVLNSESLQSVSVDGDTGATVLSGSSNSIKDLSLVPVMEHRIVASSPAATAWVLAAARRTVEVAGVGGPVTPRANQSMVSNTPGITYELSMPFGLAALDWRGLYLNIGA